MKKVISSIITAAITLLIVGCGSGEEKNISEEKNNNSIEEKTMYSNGAPAEFFEAPWLNPALYTYNKVLYDQLIGADYRLNPKEGELAKSYSLSEDGKTLNLELRDDIYWHDGEKITADDVKWSIEYSMKTAVINSVFLGTFKAIEGSEAYMNGEADGLSGIVIDGNNITITFDKIAPDALLAFGQFSPLPAKYFKDVDPLMFQQAKFFQNPIGSGPFKVEEVKFNDYTTLVAFDKYYNGIANFSIHLTPSTGDSDTNLVNNAKSGLFDYGYTKNVSDVKALKDEENLKLTEVDVRYTKLFYVNKFDKPDGSKSPLADVRVRQAIRYAIDLETIGKSLFDDTIIPASTLTPEADKVSGLDEYEFNPEKAKALLEEANWDPNYTLDVVYYYTDQLTVDFMAAVQFYLNEVGIKMKFRLVEGDLATLLWKAPADQAKGPSAVDWDLCYAAVSALSLHEYYDRYRTGSPSNSHTPEDAKLNELIDATNSSMDIEVQRKAFYELQKYENQDMFSIPLYYQPVVLIESDKIETGISSYGNPQFHYDWNVQNWNIKD